jgi:hypothetical protein
VTTTTLQLKFDKVIDYAPPAANGEPESQQSKSMLFSELMTSVNPFAKFIIKEINERPAFSLSD